MITECKYCGSSKIVERKRYISKDNGKFDFQHTIKCLECKALLWGSIKEIEDDDFLQKNLY